MTCRHHGVRARRRKYGGRWQDTVNPHDPQPKHGEPLSAWMRRTGKQPGWAPYCLTCDTMGRMTWTPLGWTCEGKGDHFGRAGCGNQIGRDFMRLPGSPGPRPRQNDQLDFYKLVARAIMERGNNP